MEAAIGYNPEDALKEVIQGFRVCDTIAPGVLFAVCTGVFFLYKLDKKTTLRISAELAERRNAAAETATA